MSMKTTFQINGVPYAVDLSDLPADITLNTFIREHAQLTATKFMCLEGGCGACICAIKGKHPVSGEMRTWAANTCLTLLHTCADWEIITLEGIGSKRSGYHPLQKRLAKLNGSQCGYCSPGFIMNMFALLESKKNNNHQLTTFDVENSFGGSLCRCTGYRPILDCMKSFAIDSNIQLPPDCCDIEDLRARNCRKTGELCRSVKAFDTLTYDDGSVWYWPKTLQALFDALDKIGSSLYILVGGNTANGVYRRSPQVKHFLDLHAIPELHQHALTKNKLTLGANLSLSEVMDIFIEAAQKPGFEYCQQLWQHFDLIANVPVRNTGTLAGNITIKKQHPEFPSDVFITFEALDAQVIVSENATTTKTMSLMAYLKSTEIKLVIIAFELKAYPKEQYCFHSYKIMPIAQNSRAYVNAAFLLEIDTTDGKVNNSRICFGGIRPDFTHATNLETVLFGQNLYDKETIVQIFTALLNEITPDWVLPDASPEYRTKLACGLFYKFLLYTAPIDKVKPVYKSGGTILQRSISSGKQTFETITKNYPITQPIEKLEALIQCSGEATYMNDKLTTNNTVYCAFVTATIVGATIEQIDATAALAVPGVVAFFTAQDIPGVNSFVNLSLGYAPEEIFCADIVKYYDQPLGVIVAKTSDIAHYAAGKVQVIYSHHADDDLKDILPTMDAVLEANAIDRFHSFIVSPLQKLILSDPADIVGKGIFQIGSQYHFSMEPQTTIAVPYEDGLQLWCATQWMDLTQAAVASMLKIKAKDVQMEVRRLGGGYGCKISRGNQVACAASLAAYKLQRPVRFVQKIESMMSCNGKRWACRSDYEFHIKANGKIIGLRNSFYEDAGNTLNENPIPAYTIVSARSCYEVIETNLKIDGHAVLTDAPSATWCRAPGSVEGIAMIENILEHIAFEAKIDPADARLINIKRNNKLSALLPRFIETTGYRQRRKEIDNFNAQNRWTKRGLGLAIMEYVTVFEGTFPVTVSIYHSDGTVVITHGGIEMGQGINTKAAQVAAYFLGIPIELINIERSDTINGANAIVSGGSVTSESVCFAVRKACNTLNTRLNPIRTAMPKDATWPQIVQKAWQSKVNLICSDQYKEGDMQTYKIYGLALSDIEIDMLTGNSQIRRVDILEDAGESLSPYVDVGQVEGSFVMMLGYWLTEHLIYDRRTGQLLTNRTWNYKIPGAKDIPIDFRIELLQNAGHPAGFMRSKTTGEPPCCMAVSVIFAIQHAIQSARNDAGLPREWVRLGAPTTPETILLNAGSDVTAFALD